MTVVITPTIYESDDFLDLEENTIVDNIELHQEKKKRLFGEDIDLKSIYISIIAIIISIGVWYYSNLFREGLKDTTLLWFFVLLIINFIAQIFTSDAFSASLTLEQSKLVSTEQINSMLLGSILVFIFIINSKDFKNRDKINRVVMIALLIAILNSMNLSVKKKGPSIRTLRKIKEVFLNISVVLFASAIYMVIRANL